MKRVDGCKLQGGKEEGGQRVYIPWSAPIVCWPRDTYPWILIDAIPAQYTVVLRAMRCTSPYLWQRGEQSRACVQTPLLRCVYGDRLLPISDRGAAQPEVAYLLCTIPHGLGAICRRPGNEYLSEGARSC